MFPSLPFAVYNWSKINCLLSAIVIHVTGGAEVCGAGYQEQGHGFESHPDDACMHHLITCLLLAEMLNPIAVTMKEHSGLSTPYKAFSKKDNYLLLC